LSDVPSQRPPQAVSVEFVHAARGVTGWPEVTLVQVPVAFLQVWHCPGQSVWQHTPSGEHFLDKHSSPVSHLLSVPFAFLLAQVPDKEQYCVSAGQEVAVQEPEQVMVSAHRPVEHCAALCVGQVPSMVQ
jgi:hypothetical protein